MKRSDLLREFFRLTFRVRYASSRFGLFWTFLSPIVSLFVFVLVFQYILKIDVPDFPLFLFSGLVTWSFISVNAINSCYAFLRHYQIIQKIKFPYIYLVFAELLLNLMIFSINILVLTIFSFITGGKTDIFTILIYAPLCLIHLAGIVVGLSILLSTATVFIRDIPHVMEIILNIWFYTSPVIFLPDMVPSLIRGIMVFNPAFFSLVSLRKVFYDSATGGDIWTAFWINSAEIIILVTVSIIFYRKSEKNFPEKI